jgi:hypothetical protein
MIYLMLVYRFKLAKKNTSSFHKLLIFLSYLSQFLYTLPLKKNNWVITDLEN